MFQPHSPGCMLIEDLQAKELFDYLNEIDLTQVSSMASDLIEDRNR
jgi:hypothetical protein